ncbi:MAG: pentapeptide repeat-containing protein [Alphaproteobacteria bacterium]|nr:pentapeptide repeat-containing protein [Alphaproteobacteria bacterium]
MTDPKKPVWPDRPLTWTEAATLSGVYNPFTLFNWFGGYWFFWWRKHPGLRVLIEFGGAAILVAGVYGLYAELQQRDVDRATRHATLIAQIAELSANPNKDAVGPAVRRIVQLLADQGGSLAGMSLAGVDLSLLNLEGVDLRNAKLANANLSLTSLNGANLSGATLTEANLRDASLNGADLNSADLSAANLRSAKLNNANLASADLPKADLRAAHLIRANLHGATLFGADLRAAELSKANLLFADLAGADLRAAVLRKANLAFADLVDADLRASDLTDAEILSADLTRADLSGADMTGLALVFVNLSEANLSGTHMIGKEVARLVWNRTGDYEYFLRLPDEASMLREVRGLTQETILFSCQRLGADGPALTHGLVWQRRICSD